jgi:hypothetical protein
MRKRDLGRRQTFAGVVVNWDTARSDISSLWGVGNVAEYSATGEAISDLDIRHLSSFLRCLGEMRVCEIRCEDGNNQ